VEKKNDLNVFFLSTSVKGEWASVAVGQVDGGIAIWNISSAGQ
jgi:hypothetical protein